MADLMTTPVDPASLGYDGDWEILQQTSPTDRLVVRKADERVALSRELWAHLVDVSHHQALMVEGGPSFEDTEDGKELRMSIGIEGEGVGRVTYRVAEVHRDWILCERVDEHA